MENERHGMSETEIAFTNIIDLDIDKEDRLINAKTSLGEADSHEGHRNYLKAAVREMKPTLDMFLSESREQGLRLYRTFLRSAAALSKYSSEDCNIRRQFYRGMMQKFNAYANCLRDHVDSRVKAAIEADKKAKGLAGGLEDLK